MTAHQPRQLNAGTAGAASTSPVAQATPQPGRYEIDTARSAVTFRTRHLFGLAPVRGSFAIRAGTIDVAEPLTDPGIYAEIEAASFRTGNGQRDSAVRSARLLDAGQHRVITFRSEHLDGLALTGTLTVRDVTQPVSLSIEQSAVSPGVVHRPRGHADRPDRVRGDRIPRAGRTLPRHDGGGPVRTRVTSAADMTTQTAIRAGTPSAGAVVVAGLRKSYGAVQAVRGVSFTVEHGEIFALLGPNGAGKTTILEILEGFRTRDAGRVDVLGADPGDRSEGRALRERIGLVLQDIAVEPYLTVRETIARNAGYYPTPRDVGEVIDLVGLAGQERKKVRNLSGGQKRRLDLALIGQPDLLFLDEPTTGFDPNARRDAWEVVRNLRGAGTTIMLTTHYMDEAQALADRVAVISDGQIVAEGTPATIGGRDHARACIRFTLPPGWTAADLPVAATPADGLVTVQTADPTQTLHELTGWALAHGIVLGQLAVDRPSLEDIYLRLTEHGTAEPRPQRSTR